MRLYSVRTPLSRWQARNYKQVIAGRPGFDFLVTERRIEGITKMTADGLQCGETSQAVCFGDESDRPA